MADIRSTTTNYQHPTDPNLLNIHKAMKFNSDGEPVVRTHVDGITLEGDVIVDTVSLSSSTLAALESINVQNNVTATVTGTVAVSNFPTTSTVYQGTSPWIVSGNVTVTNFTSTVNINSMPAVSGTVTVSNFTSTVHVDNFPTSVTVTNFTSTVYVANTVTVAQGTSPWVVTGTVAVGSISGTVDIIPGGASSVSAFGEPYGLTITPVIQLDGIYGITTDVIQTYNTGTGSAATATPQQGLFTVQGGTTPYGYGVLRSRRFLRYRPGQGALARFTAAFTTGTSLSSQRAGLFNEENSIMVGWNPDAGNGGTPKFGVLRSTGGKTEIRQLTINSITVGSQTLTVTLDGTAYTVTVNTADTTAAAVAIANHNGGFPGWLVDQVDNTLVFLSTTMGAKNGTYSLTGSGTVSGTFVQRQLGVAQTENWTYQGSFNVDNLDGTGPSGMTLHSQYLNVYQINFRWLGAGEIRYAIEDRTTGKMVFFHREHYTDRNLLPHTAQPSFKIGYVSYNLGTSTNATVLGASMMAAIEGEIKQNELNRSAQSIKSNLSKDVCYHLLTIRNPYVTNGKAGALNGNFVLNAKELILKNISIGVQGNDPGIVYMFYNAASFSGTHSYASQPRDNGMISTVDGTMDYLVDTAVCRFVTAINGSSAFDLTPFRLAIPPGDSVSIAVQSTNGLTRVSLALVFSED